MCFPGLISGLRRHFQDAGTDQENLLNSGFMSLVFSCFYECVFLVLFQASEDISKTLVLIKNMQYGTVDQEPQTELVAQLAQEMYNSNILITLVNDLYLIDFEVGIAWHFW